MTENEMLTAGTLWTEYQLKNTTPVELFSQIKETVKKIKIPQGICSQNSSENINLVLEKNNLAHKFQSIIGYDDIPDHSQKPNPLSGINCLKQIFENITNKLIIYIGDHEGDVQFAQNIERELKGNSKVISIAAKYSGAETETWECKPDYEIDSPLELIEIIEKLQATQAQKQEKKKNLTSNKQNKA